MDDSSLQEDVYSECCRRIVKEAWRGINGTIFAYGETNSGKTYTISGTTYSRGVIEYAACDLFGLIEESNKDGMLLACVFSE